MREDLLARRIFYTGCVCLPWLWAVNVLYFRKKVYGPIPFIDRPDHDHDGDADAGEGGEGAAQQQQQQQQQQGMTMGTEGLMSGVMANMTDGDDEDSDDEYNDVPSDTAAEITEAEIRNETVKWVKRSTYGTLLATCLFVTWIVVFQVNKDNFSSGWFVMSEDESELTGW